MARLDAARAAAGLDAMPAGAPVESVLARLEALDLTPHEELVEWFAHYGAGPLLYRVDVPSLDDACGRYLDGIEMVGDDPGPEAIDWFPIADYVVMFARPCGNAPQVRRINEVFEFSAPTAASDLAVVVELWADRLDRGYYIPNPTTGLPWFDGEFPDDELWLTTRL